MKGTFLINVYTIGLIKVELKSSYFSTNWSWVVKTSEKISVGWNGTKKTYFESPGPYLLICMGDTSSTNANNPSFSQRKILARHTYEKTCQVFMYIYIMVISISSLAKLAQKVSMRLVHVSIHRYIPQYKP